MDPLGILKDPYGSANHSLGNEGLDNKSILMSVYMPYSRRIISPDVLQRNRLAPYENAYNRGGGGVTSVTTKSQAVYNSRYDEPAEFRDSFYRPNEFTSKFASWAEPFYKSWSSSSWDKESPSYSGNRGSSSFSWDREPQLNRGGGGSWDREPQLNRGGGDNRGSSWDNRGSTWDKELVEVPLQKPSGGARDNFNSDKYPEVAVVHSGVIDVRGDRQQNSSPHPTPPPRFTIIDVDPKPYHQQQNNIVQPQQMPPSMRYDERSKPMRYESPMQPTRYEPPMPYDAPQKPMRYEAYTPMQPPTRYEQQYRPQQQQQPPQSSWTSTSSSSSSSTRDGQQNQNKKPTNGYVVHNINLPIHNYYVFFFLQLVLGNVNRVKISVSNKRYQFVLILLIWNLSLFTCLKTNTQITHVMTVLKISVDIVSMLLH